MFRSMRFLVMLAARTSLAKDEDDKVIALDNASFHVAIEANERVLVEFYAPWCGHCKKLEPEFEKAAAIVHSEALKTILAKVDATVEKDLAKKFNVSGYPTLYYFFKGEHKSYKGPRDASGIADYVRKRELPVLQVVTTEEVATLLSGLDNREFAVIAHVKNKSARYRALYNAVETHLLDYSVSRVRFAAVMLPKAANPKKDAQLVLHRPGFPEYEGKLASFTGPWSADSIAKWLKQSTYQRLGSHFTSQYHWKNIESLGWEGVVAACVETFDADSEDAVDDDNIKPKVLKVLDQLVDKYPKWKFTFCELGKLETRDKKTLGVEEGSDPLISVTRGERKRFVLEGAQNIQQKDKVEQFLADVNAGKLKPHYKSESKPLSDMDEDGVTVLTGDTFEEKVMNSKNDVFVLFYAPWCGHCKKLAPIWAELAQKVQKSGWDTKGVMIAKLDATANECEENTKGFPTMVLYPAVASDRKMKQRRFYGGARELGSFVQFLLNHARGLDEVEGSDEDIKDNEKLKSIVQRELEMKRRNGKGKKQDL